MYRCCASRCNNEGVHKFPKNESIRTLWELAVNSKGFKAAKRSRLCTDHFKLEDYIIESCETGIKLTTRRLKKGVIPTLFNKSNSKSLRGEERRKTSEGQRELLSKIESLDQNATHSVNEDINHIAGEKFNQHKSSCLFVPNEPAIFMREVGTLKTYSRKRGQHGEKNVKVKRKKADIVGESSTLELNKCSPLLAQFDVPGDGPENRFPFSWQKSYPIEFEKEDAVSDDTLSAEEFKMELPESEDEQTGPNEVPTGDFVKDNIPEKHTGFTCDSCMGDIIGFRYSCVQCARFEQCAACEARRAHRHHHVLRLPAPARGPSNEVDNVIAAIRAKIDVLENAMKQNSATWYNDVVIKKEEFEVEVDTERHTEPEEVSFEEPTARDVVPKAEPEYNETTEELITPEIDSDIYGTKCRIKKERDLNYEDDKEAIEEHINSIWNENSLTQRLKRKKRKLV